MKSYKKNQHTNRLGLKRSVVRSLLKLLFVTLFVILSIQVFHYWQRLSYYRWRDQNIWAAPCPNFCEQGYSGFRVYAAEPTPTVDPKWSNVVKLIVDEFEEEGPQVTYQAISVAKTESGWRSNARNVNTNGTVDSCPFQVNSVHDKRYGTKYKHDVKECIRVAHVIYKQQGWQPWVAARKLGYVD